MRISTPSPILSHKFLVISSDGFLIRCNEIAGFGVEQSVFTYNEGGNNFSPLVLPDKVNFAPVTLRQGVIEGDSKLWDWVKARFLLDIPVIPVPSIRKTLEIKVAKNEKLIITIYDAMIQRWELSGLNATTSGILFQSVTLTHSGINIK